jgi:ABC-type dipeptide/oligopeptide/nickel transport system permease component
VSEAAAAAPSRPAFRPGLVVLRSLLEALAALAATAVLVVWIADAALSNVAIGDLTLNVLLGSVDPFRGMTTAEALGTAMQRTGALLLAALAGASALGIALGMVFSLSVFGPLRAVAWAVGTAGVALPSFFWAMLLQLAAVSAFLVTGQRPLPVQGFGLDEHLLLPAIALGARPAAYLFRTTASAFEDVRHGDYVRAARAKGLLERVVVVRHMLPNAGPAILGGFGIAARSALSSAAIVEYVFTWNGAGFGFIQAVARGDVALATAIALAFALLFALVGVAVSVGARLADPRVER